MSRDRFGCVFFLSLSREMLLVETNSTSKQPTTFAEGEGGHSMSPREEITNMNFFVSTQTL